MADNELIEKLCQRCKKQFANKPCEPSECALLAVVVNAVEVIRCKECKYWIHMEDGFGDCINGRFHLDGCPDPTMKLDDFCSCGEKREEA